MRDARMRLVVRAALRALGYSSSAVEVTLMSDRAMSDLKYKTTGLRPRAVNVLAFEAPKEFPHPGTKVFLGEVYVNAERYGMDWEEMAFLAVHGILHCAGFRHERARDTMKMRRMEKKLLARIRKYL